MFFAQAKATLIERGCQLLRKDGLLDEDVFKRAKATQHSMEDSLKKLEGSVETIQARLARLLAEFAASQAKLKQRLSRIEARLLCQFVFSLIKLSFSQVGTRTRR